MTLSAKQIHAIANSNARINIWEGSVRSGKSFSALISFLDFIIHGPKGDMAIIGRTQDSIKRNIVSELFNLIGEDAKYFSGKREITLYGRTIHIIGASDERAEQKIRGSSLAGALVDEVTIIPESFFMMLLSRLSIDGARLFITTNPDSPFHWFKIKILDRKNELDMKVFSFNLEDNPSLTIEYKNNLKQEYSGLWYDRYIDGKWCLAEGIIYDFFDTKIHTLDFVPSVAPNYYIAGIDYGTTNPCVFLLVGYNKDHYPNIWVEKEYYYDPSTTLKQKTDSEFTDDFIRFIDNLSMPLKAIYIDPSAASFKQELMRSGIRNVIDANNDVLDGIRFTAKKMSNGTLKILNSCKNTLKEIGSYVWDSKAKEVGIDKPIKKNDHCLDCIRYIIFTHFKDLDSFDDPMTPETLKNLRARWGIK